jgi:hypothetical protein
MAIKTVRPLCCSVRNVEWLNLSADVDDLPGPESAGRLCDETRHPFASTILVKPVCSSYCQCFHQLARFDTECRQAE